MQSACDILPVMMSVFKKYGLAYVFVGIAAAVSAFLLKDSEYENMWIFVFGAGMILVGIFEVYLKNQKK